MGIFASLHTGISGLKASEVQIATTSNNIANANSSFYTRQRAVQKSTGFYHAGNLEIGMGTTVETVMRLHDEFAYFKLKGATTQKEYTKYMGDMLKGISQRFPDVKEAGILNDLKNYNLAWNDFSSNPNETATKITLIKASQTLTNSLNSTYSTLKSMQNQVNEDLKASVDEINRIGQEVAELSKQINYNEILKSDHANALRDRRDELELTLSKLVSGVASKHQITYNTLKDRVSETTKQYTLTIEGYPLVSNEGFHPLKLIHDDIHNAYKVVYETPDEKIRDLTESINGGQLGAQLDLRGRTYKKTEAKYEGGIIQGYLDSIDTFAKTLINETNNIYASSAKPSAASDYMKGLRADIPVMNYDRTVQAGSFDLVVYDDKGDEKVRREIRIEPGMSFTSLLGQINANVDDNRDNNNLNDMDDYVRAGFAYSEGSDTGFFQITPVNTGYKISLQDKGTNFPGAFSIGGFFSGTGAGDIRLKDSLINDPGTVRASQNGVDSNNDMANKIIQLQYEKVNFYNRDHTTDTLTMEQYYRKFTGQIAADGENNEVLHTSNTTLYNTVQSEYEATSGVNTNEELAALIQYQASYGAASKVITTIDQMLNTLLSIKS